MRIEVQQKHIEAASCRDPRRCMIAEAIRDCVKQVSFVSVRTNGITITQRRQAGGSVRSHWSVPLKAAKAIIKFDNKQPVAPFCFEPKLIDRVIMPMLTEKQREANRKAQQVKRATYRRSGRKELWRLRIAGV